MSDIRFNRWLHQSGTGGVYQDSTGNIGIGTSVPTSSLDVQSGTIKIGSNTLSSTGVSTFTTVNANSVISNSVSATSIVGVATAGITTAYVTSINDGPLSGARNRIINGDCRIDQRNNGAAINSSSGGTFAIDRFASYASGGGVYTTQRSTDVPTGQGFVNSIVSTVTTTDSPTGADYYIIQQTIEGFNTSDLQWGTASARTVTLSFWVKSSLSGLYTVAFRNSANNRSYRATYTITSVNTWEKKIITIPGDTTGTWLSDNGAGLRIGFTLGAGSDFIDTGNVWSGVEDFAATGQTQWIATNGATFYLTGIQLESGTVASAFERRLYGQELSLCHRYYRRYNSTGTTYTAFGVGLTASSTAVSRWGFNLDIPMRTTPVPAFTNCVGWNGNVGGAVSLNVNFSSTNFIDADLTTSGLINTIGLTFKVLMLSNGFIELTGCEL